MQKNHPDHHRKNVPWCQRASIQRIIIITIIIIVLIITVVIIMIIIVIIMIITGNKLQGVREHMLNCHPEGSSSPPCGLLP